ncbi:hypothetical protein ACHAXS_008464 [Conticribra weissflogii]
MVATFQSFLRSSSRRGLSLRNSSQARTQLPVVSQAVRTYLGDAGEMKSRRANAAADSIAQREQQLWERAQPRYDSIMERHIRLPTLDNVAFEPDINNNMDGTSKEERELDIRKKRLVYRSKQRGWLEVDLLLGTWASENVPSLSLDELDEFEKFVNLETIDIYNVLTLRSDVPEDMKAAEDDGRKSVVERIQEWAKKSPLGKADKDKYVEVKIKNNLI